MFYYHWLSQTEQHQMSQWLSFDRMLGAGREAIEAGERVFAFEVLGRYYKQGIFNCQADCLDKLRQRYAALGPAAPAQLKPLLDDIGCLEAFEKYLL